MNKQLSALYEVNWEVLRKTTDKYEAQGYTLANPYLLTASDNYQNAKVRVMCMGEETMGWEASLRANLQLRNYNNFTPATSIMRGATMQHFIVLWGGYLHCLPMLRSFPIIFPLNPPLTKGDLGGI